MSWSQASAPRLPVMLQRPRTFGLFAATMILQIIRACPKKRIQIKHVRVNILILSAPLYLDTEVSIIFWWRDNASPNGDVCQAVRSTYTIWNTLFYRLFPDITSRGRFCCCQFVRLSSWFTQILRFNWLTSHAADITIILSSTADFPPLLRGTSFTSELWIPRTFALTHFCNAI